MGAFALNLALMGLWALLFKGRLNPKNNGSKLFLVVVSAQLLAFVLFSPIVSDAVVYADAASIGDYDGWELGWGVFSALVWQCVPDAKALVMATSFVLTVSCAMFAWRHSCNMALTMFLFVVTGIWGLSFYVLRQSMALAILLFSVCFVERRRPVVFLLLVFLAAQFHQTAYVFLLIYPLSFFRRAGVYHLVAIMGGAMFFLLGPQIVNFIMAFSRIDYGASEISGQWYLIMLIVMQAFVALCSKRERDSVANHMVEAGSVFQVLALNFSLLNRMVQYFSAGLMVAIPAALSEISDRQTRFFFTSIVVALFLLYYFFVLDCAFPGGADMYVAASLVINR